MPLKNNSMKPIVNIDSVTSSSIFVYVPVIGLLQSLVEARLPIKVTTKVFRWIHPMSLILS
jgi:hypothetical protein